MLWPVAHSTQYALGPAMLRWICSNGNSVSSSSLALHDEGHAAFANRQQQGGLWPVPIE